MVLLRYFRNHFKPHIYGHGYRGLFKQGMVEAPASTICGIFCPLIVLIATPPFLYKHFKSGNERRRYFFRYNIFRPDDDRLDWLTLPPKLDAELKERRSKAAT